MKNNSRKKILISTLFFLLFIPLLFSFNNLTDHSKSNFLYANEKNNIVDYNISRESQSKNDVSYSINYEENDVWYWDARKSDFSPPSWKQRKFDKWEYSTNPTFGMEYIGSLDEGEPVPPAPHYSSWSSSPGTYYGSYVYTWTNKYHKASMPKIDRKDRKKWEVTYQDDFDSDWYQSSFNKWGWSQDHGNWNHPTRVNTGNANKDVWVEWKITSKNIVEQQGNFNIVDSLHDLNKTESDPTSYNNEYNQPYFDMSDSDNKKPPSIDIPEPKDGDVEGIGGNKTLKIKNLALGWKYDFSANLNYKDKDGNIKTYKTFDDDFTTDRNSPTDEINAFSDSPDSITYSIKVNDPNSSRTSPIRWQLKDQNNIIIDSGECNSNNFVKTFFNLSEDSSYNLEYDYDYKLSPDDLKTNSHNLKKSTKNYYKNTIKNKGVSVTNISKDQMILNSNFETNNNFIDPKIYDSFGVSIKYFNTSGEKVIKDIKASSKEIHPGTNSYLFKYSEFDPGGIDFSKEIDVSSWVVNKTTGEKITSDDMEYTLDTNTEVNFSILTKNSNVTNNQATINYSLSGNFDNINKLQYKIDDSHWNDIDFEKKSDEQSFIIDGLSGSTSYNLSIRGISNDHTIYANPFSFTTDRDSSMKIIEALPGENSLTLVTSFDKIEYLDNNYFDWNIMEKDTGKFIIEGRQDVLSNGQISTEINNLNLNTDYIITTNISINHKIVPYDVEMTTSKNSFDHTNNAFVTNIKKKKSNKFELDYVGCVKTVKYSIDDGKNWVNVNDFHFDNKKIYLDIKETDYNEIYFMMNDSFNSLSSWHNGIDNHLVLIKHPFKVNVAILVFVVILLFIFLTVLGTSLWAKWWKNKKVKSEKINMWKK